MKKLAFLLIILGLFGCRWLNKPPELNPKPVILSPVGLDFVKGNNKLAINLLREINNQGDTNTIISPLSLSTILAMLENGAVDETYKELAQFLNLKDSVTYLNKQIYSFFNQLVMLDPQVIIKLANSIWFNKDYVSVVNQNFVFTMSEYYKAQIETEPFDQNTVNLINNWVYNATNGLIPNIVSKLSPNDLLLAINVLYFNGLWFDDFDKNNTQKKSFYLNDNKTIDVITMCDEISRIGLAYFDNITVGELYYGIGNYSMVFLIPDYDIDSLVNKLDDQLWNDLLTRIKVQNDIYVELPKFKAEPTYNFSEYLKRLGLKRLFSPDSSQLDNIAPNAYVSQIKQKIYFNVDEQGTEAAAATSATVGTTSAFPQQLIINKPFIFAIRETQSNVILFMGIIKDPSRLQ